MTSSLVLEVEYVRELSATEPSGDASTVAATSGIVYKLKARLREIGVRAASLNRYDSQH